MLIHTKTPESCACGQYKGIDYVMAVWWEVQPPTQDCQPDQHFTAVVIAGPWEELTTQQSHQLAHQDNTGNCPWSQPACLGQPVDGYGNTYPSGYQPIDTSGGINR